MIRCRKPVRCLRSCRHDGPDGFPAKNNRFLLSFSMSDNKEPAGSFHCYSSVYQLFFIPPVLFLFLLVYNMELTIFFILSNDVLPDSLYRIPSTTKIIISQLKFLYPLKTLVFPAFSPTRSGPFLCLTDKSIKLFLERR